MKRFFVSSALALLGLCASERAEARPLEATDVSSQKIRIDGLLREWPKNFDRLSEAVRGSGSGDPSAAFRLGAVRRPRTVAGSLGGSGARRYTLGSAFVKR